MPLAHPVDYRMAFEHAPVGLVLSRQRVMVDVNHALADMFGTTRDALLGQSFALLYPTPEEFEQTGQRIAPILNRSGRYADDRIMKRLGTSAELFWCHVTGRALDRGDPHAAGIWSFEDLSAQRRVSADLTRREREIAALLVDGLTSKQIGKLLGISHRTVEIHRAKLLRKYRVGSARELVKALGV
jgi:PAS domain S-box-containing protein